MQKLETSIVKLLILFLPSQLAFHLWPEWSLVFGIRVDYLSPTIYFTDILIAGVVLLHIYNRRATRFFPNAFIFLFILFSFLNIVFALNVPIAIYKWGRVLEYFLLGWVLLDNKGKNFVHSFQKQFSVAAIYTAVIAVVQFGLQKNIGGVLYWLGERPLMVSMTGMAKTTILGHEYLRPYATFPHPNVLGAFGLVTCLFLFSSWKSSWITKLGITASLVIVVLSFSQAIWITLSVLILLARLKREKLQSIARVTLVLSVVVSFVLVFINPEFKNYSIDSRIALANTSGEVLQRFPIMGTGLGNFITANQENILHFFVTVRDGRLRFQPVHNVPLLLISEVGLIGFTIVMVWLLTFINRANKKGTLGVIVILIISVVDHYWLTLHQGSLLLVFIIVVGLSSQRIISGRIISDRIDKL